MAKCVLGSRREHHLIYQLGTNKLRQRGVTEVVGIAKNNAEQVQIKAGADDRCGVKRALCGC